MGSGNDEDHESKALQISGCYKILQGTSPKSTLIEHSCLMTVGNKWNIVVKCRPILNGIKGESHHTDSWRSIKEVYPDAKVEHKHNDIEVTLPSLQEDIEIAAFGSPGEDDQKRMQMAIFGRHPTQGRGWKIWVFLVDDTDTACKKICQRQEERGNRLLTPFAGLFVPNSNEDIRIEISALEPGWNIKESKVKTIKSKDAWNSPENSADFPGCHFEIEHENKTKQSFFCGITASHGGDKACTEIVAYFERERGREIVQPSENVQRLCNSCHINTTFQKSQTPGLIPVFFLVLSFLVAWDFQTTRFTVTTGSTPTYQQFYDNEGCTNRNPQGTYIRCISKATCKRSALKVRTTNQKNDKLRHIY